MRKLHLPCNRHERLLMIRNAFPDAPGPDLTGNWQGGRVHALKRLAEVDGLAYQRNRNFLNGAVTRLSPYLRHGCISLKEAFDSVRNRFGDQAQKLLFELAWRDYWRQVWYYSGDAILSDMEPAKVTLACESLPDDICSGSTGLPCMDGFIADLLADGYVHNHARMWFASYVLHWRKVDWRAAADWYEAYLLDGDKASNHLSWQWVASTFGSKPYFFNRENLEKYTNGKYCKTCKVNCPFDNSYEALSQQLFSNHPLPARKMYKAKTLVDADVKVGAEEIVLVHDEMLSSAHLLMRHAARKVFVFDPALHGDWALHRLQFIADCLSELEEVELWSGDTRQVLAALNVGHVTTQATPNRSLRRLLAAFSVQWLPETPLTEISLEAKDLRRFSRYWAKVGPYILGDSEYRKP